MAATARAPDPSTSTTMDPTSLCNVLSKNLKIHVAAVAFYRGETTLKNTLITLSLCTTKPLKIAYVFDLYASILCHYAGNESFMNL